MRSIVDSGGSTARRWLAIFVAAATLVACQQGHLPTAGATGVAATPAGSPGASVAATAGASAAPTEPGTPTTGPTDAPIPTAGATVGFRYGDVLKVTVNALRVRRQPRTDAAILHEWDIFKEPPEDLGNVNLNTGDFVSVHLGPLQVSNRFWYLLWEAKDGVPQQSDHGWYAEPPFGGSLVPGWAAASQGNDRYMTLHRHATPAELEGMGPIGVNAAGTGGGVYASEPQPRHDGFSFDWAIAATNQGSACTARILLVPSDPDADPFVAVEASTSTVKVSPVGGVFVDTHWLPIPDGSWTEFTVQVEGTCAWALRLSPLHHD